MPGFDGTGPSGQGPMTGQSRGFCALRISKENPVNLKGFAGLQGVPVIDTVKNFENAGKVVINMPFGNGTGPPGMGSIAGRAAGFWASLPMQRLMNPVVNRVGYHSPGVSVFGPYGAGLYDYGALYAAFYAGSFSPWLCRGFGRGRGRGRGRFGYW